MITKISEKKFRQNDFEELSKNNLSKIEIDSIKDDKKFSTDSVKFLYAKSKNNFALIGDKDKNIYLIKIIDVSYKNISNNSENLLLYKKQTNDKIRDNIYGSYDIFINNKYKVKINEKSVERVKNYFR